MLGIADMGRAHCCDKANVKKGPWSSEEDTKLKTYIEKHVIYLLPFGFLLIINQTSSLRKLGGTEVFRVLIVWRNQHH
ncbi:unnamed protein product [Lupinus luteus]|uniref:Uncharacterized protein n=1 Tax=Lupinus luteus TaxID=3873 RepID=A0AAV1VXL3_LUPLU